MKKNKIVLKSLVLLFFIVFSYTLSSQQIAFPTAEGSGRFATGGRGGTIYEVTNLNNSGAGSIVDALSVGNRTVVFRVSGTISLGDVVLMPKANTTIAGQTAPGDGICIKGRIQIEADNIIIRYLKVRVDAGGKNSSGDAVDIAGGTNIIIDHVSASYSRDEGISCRETSNKVTVQWCIISEALTYENHSFGSLVRGDYGDEKTYHHNLYAHNLGRQPRPGNYTEIAKDPVGLHFDFRNNVVYNWQANKVGYNDDIDHLSQYNFIGNAYIRGPESDPSTTKQMQIFRENCLVCGGFFENNSYDNVVPADPYSLVSFVNFTDAQIAAYKSRSILLTMQPVTTTSPAQAKTDVLAAAGASLPKRDIIDSRIVNDVLNKTGHSIDSTIHQPEGGWPVLNSLPAPADTDHDGMPDAWEDANLLDKNNPNDRNIVASNGYTMVEIYLNSIVSNNPTDNKIIPENDKSISVYPNPFDENIDIKLNDKAANDATVKIFNGVGNLVAQYFPDTELYSLNTQSYQNGIYLIYVQNNGRASIKILLKK